VVHGVGDLDFTSYTPFGIFYFDQTLATIWASEDVLYDPAFKQFIIGETIDASELAMYPLMKSQIHIDDGYGPQRVFGIYNHTSGLIDYILDYQGTTQGIRNGINVETPYSTIDMRPGAEFSVSTRADAVIHNTGSAIGLYFSPTSIAGGEYYKVMNMYSETGHPLISMVGQKNEANNNFLHIGVAKKEGGFGDVDETWLSLGEGKVYGTEFSGSGASLTNIPYSSIVNLPSIVSSSAQVKTLLPVNTVSSSAQVDIRSSSYSSYVTRTISYVTGNTLSDQYFSNTLYTTPQSILFATSAYLQNNDVTTEVVSSSYVRLPEAGTYMCEWNVRVRSATGVAWLAALYGSLDAPSSIYSSSLYSSSFTNDNYINTRYTMSTTSSLSFVGLGVLFDNLTTNIPRQTGTLNESTFFVTQIKRGT
jgi:hypothetical protein